MNTIDKNSETNQTQILTDRFHLSNRDLMDYLSDPEELDAWSIDDLQDVLPSEKNLDNGEFDYGWDDSLSIDHTHAFLD